MAQVIFVGIGAGIVSALLFASVVSGTVLSVFLFYLAPLPIMIAALGWSHWAGLTGAIVGSVCLIAALGGYFFFAFLIAIGLPAWWLGYLTLLARGNMTGDSLEWYPVGRLVLWSAAIASVVVVAAIPQFGLDLQSFQTGLKRAFEHFLDAQTGAGADAPSDLPGVSDPAWLIDFLVLTAFPAAAVASTLVLTFNLWLAGSVVKISGRLTRPWPNISAMTFPRFAPGLIAGALACSLLPDLMGTASGIFAASLLMAYTLLGFAVLHAITREMRGRGLVLATAYAVVLVFRWPLLAMPVLGLADALFNLRLRFGSRLGRPPVPPQ
jgi:Predicted membrane protein (DUF2232)